jgi:iron complex outermembrane recepter protein
LTDPCNGGATADKPGCAGVPSTYTQPNAQIRETRQSDPNLQPETSESLTVGFVYNPSWLEGAELTVDYYDIEVEEAIARIGAQKILNDCAVDASSVLCERIDRDENGNVTDLRNGLENQSTYLVKGVDAYAAYRLPDTAYGSFKVYVDGSYVIDSEINGDEYVGMQWGDAGYARIKASSGIDWMSGDWNANYQARYVHHMRTYYSQFYTAEEGFNQRIGSYIVHDVSVGYNISAYNAKVTVGVENLFAKEPQPEGLNNGYSASTNNFSVTEYDVNMDRFVYLRGTIKF